jgi:hypothetical protein
MRIVIARGGKGYFLRIIAFFVALLIGSFVIFLHGVRENSDGAAAMVVPISIASLHLMLLVKRVVMDDCRGVWIENGSLIVFHKWYFSVSCSKIADVWSGTSEVSGRPAINLRLRDGKKKWILTWGLVEEDGVVIARLKEAIPSINTNIAREPLSLRDQMACN